MNPSYLYCEKIKSDILKDKHRPIYHFSPDNWMNDPIPFHNNDEYHIFFQYNPNGAFWDSIHWGHIFSKDLVHWYDLPIALSPTPNSIDRDGCFTGCVVEERNKYYIFYTGVPLLTPLTQTQCLAKSNDLIAWKKYKGNPLNVTKPDGYGECFRDPCVWKEKNNWYMIIGGENLQNKGGVSYLYRSNDLIDWQYIHTIFEGEEKRSGFDFECPDFFPLDDKYILLTSRHHTWWRVGTYHNYKFTVENFGTIDGGSLYAAKTMLDHKGRRILWGWIKEERSEAEQKDARWSGVLSLPREIFLRSDGMLGIKPVQEMEALRGNYKRFDEIFIANNTKILLNEIEGDSLEIVAKFSHSHAKKFGIMVTCKHDVSDGVEIYYDNERKTFLDMPFDLKENEDLTLHIFIDRSVIEVFANEIACQTFRSYAKNDDYQNIGLFSFGGSSKIDYVDSWEIRSIWRN